MTLTAVQIQDQIIREVGDVDSTTGDQPGDPDDGVLAINIRFLWTKYAAKDRIAPGLRELYVKRACVRMVLAVLAQRRFDAVDVLAGLNAKTGQVWDHYQEMHKCAKEEIVAILKATAGSEFGVTPLTTAAPTVSNTGCLDPNHPYYGGSPLRRTWPRSSS